MISPRETTVAQSKGEELLSFFVKGGQDTLPVNQSHLQGSSWEPP